MQNPEAAHYCARCGGLLLSESASTQTNAKALILELELCQTIVTQEFDELAQLLHIHGRSRSLRSAIALPCRVTLFFRC